MGDVYGCGRLGGQMISPYDENYSLSACVSLFHRGKISHITY